MNTKEDLYIKVLSYGREHIGKPIKYAELEQHLKDEGVEYDDFALTQFFHGLFINKHYPAGNHPGQAPTDEGDYYLEHNGYFNLLEHEELLEARQSSRRAMYIAIAALCVSILTGGLSIYYSNQQLNRPTSIELSQFEKLDNSSLRDVLKEIESTQNVILIETKGIKAELLKKNTRD